MKTALAKIYCTMNKDNSDFKEIGKSYFGTVYKSATIERCNEFRALKKFNKLSGAELTGKVLNELLVQMNLPDHPNVDKIVDVYLIDQCIHRLTQFADLGTLDTYLNCYEGTPQIEVELKIMEDSATGLHFLHTSCPKIFHRNIKLSNIVIHRVDSQIVAKLCDFGFSTYSVVSNGNYLPPEVFWHPNKTYVGAVDVFGLGLVFMIIWKYCESCKSLEAFPDFIWERTSNLSFL